MRHQIILQVNDLDQSRYFYREVVGLGEPVIDSTVLASFMLDEESVLTLVKSRAAYLEHGSGALFWSLTLSDPEAAFARLEKNGTPAGEPYDWLDGIWRRCCDPEGNPFLIRCQAEK